MKYGISENSFFEIIKHIKNCLGKTVNPHLYIYGSRVKGNHRKFSDVDLLLQADYFDKDALAKLDFSELDIPYKIDFVTEDELFPEYANEINSHREQIF